MTGGVAGARPRFSAAEAEEIARSRFGVEGDATELPSDRDQNFRVDGEGPAPTARDERADAPARRFVLKIASRSEDPAVLDLQHRALAHASRNDPGLPIPGLLPTVDDEETAEVTDDEGRAHRVRMVRWLPGRPLAEVRPRLPELLEEVGSVLARLDVALEDFSHPAAERDFHWDVARAPEVVEERLELIEATDRRALLERHLARVTERAGSILEELPRSVIHGDANDHNVLVRVAGPEALREAVRVAGLIDFGDMVRSFTVAELAVACAYAGLGSEDPVRTVRPLVRGYHGVRPLGEDEVEALFPLIVLRMCASASIAAAQTAAEPGNDYLRVSEEGAWRFLRWADETSWTRAHYMARHACGMEPCPRAPHVVSWLEEHGGDAAPVLRPNPATEEHRIFDFSVAEREWTAVPLEAGPDEWTDRIFGRMSHEEVRVALGRWDEPRRWYTSEIFRDEAGSDDDPPDPRTVHLGLDIFVRPGSPVYSPLAGRIYAVTSNIRPLDYGPTLTLIHEADGIPFWTLFGHLGREALEAWEPGDEVARGQQIATVGTYPVNGGWTPHLHFQILLDPMERAGDYPGVARPSEREFWLSLSPDPNLLLGVPGLEPASRGRSTEEITAHRRRHLGPNLSTSYRRPLKIVRGWMQKLYDEDGRDYLDARNNVPHVGHCHPRVVDAARLQNAVLDTNTRYLHDSLVEYTGRLVETLPEPLSVCWLVCTGSEANELALRLARACTGTRETIVLDVAYHGNTNALIEISPYKFGGTGGAGAPDHVHVAPLPDPYRGLYRDDPEAGPKYAAHVKEIVERLAEDGRGPATFVAEPIAGCGGQVVPPDGFLREAFRHVKEAGGVTIADEVQVGFGRIGTHFWAFEAQDAVPDIVTIGKPAGNGHPLAAVVCTPEVAEAFDTGMEYFNTFGGTPVACEVGLAVLDVIEDEGLQRRALDVGEKLKRGLGALGERHELVGDVRGSGLFLGVELVTDRDARTPATAHTRYVVERLRDHRILAGSDGADDNVLKLKPPLQFGPGDADRLVATLDRILGESPLR